MWWESGAGQVWDLAGMDRVWSAWCGKSVKEKSLSPVWAQRVAVAWFSKAH